MQLVSDTSNPHILSNAKHKDESLFMDRFYSSYRSEFLKWSYKIYGLQSEVAIDIYQDAVIVLFENYRNGKLNDLRATVKTYFYGIAKNMIFVHLKKRNRQMAYTDVFPDADSADTQQRKEIDAAQEWLDDTLEVISRGVESLPAKGREIIQLFYYEKKSLREINGILKYSSENVVKTTKMRYKKVLKQWVEEEMNRRLAS